MIYMGIVVDGVYGEPDQPINEYRKWTRLNTNRIYSDEVTIARGIFAYNRMFTLRRQFKYEASRAWKNLI